MTSSTPTNDADLVAVGKIGRAHGIRGEVFVEPWTDAPRERFRPGAVLLAQPRASTSPSSSLTVSSSRDHSGKLVVHFAGITSRSDAESITGTMVFMYAADRPPIEDEDEFYDTDLTGLSARFIGEGADLADGVVVDVLHIPSGSVLAVDVAGREILVPFRREIVPVVDIAAGFVQIDPPEGLLDI